MNVNVHKKTDVTKKWVKMMRIGAATGCHQRADRSFFWNGHQFPICARCTGVLIGYVLAIISIVIFLPNFLMGMIFCIVMLTDWLVQFFRIHESNNVRRLMTGILGGYGIITCEFNIVLYILLILM